jgi:segregation and condensation protein B
MSGVAQARMSFAEEDLASAMALGRAVRIAEALLFAAREPLSEAEIAAALPAGVSAREAIAHLQPHYAGRGVNLVAIAGRWAFRTAPDLGHLMRKDVEEPRKLSRAAIETLAIVAYHQPVTRAEIEEIRGVATAKGTLDVLLETGWIRMRGRRRTPGRPITFGTTEAFLSHFGLGAVGDLPGLDELRSAGLFDGKLPRGMAVAPPSDDPRLGADEDPLEPDVLAEAREARIDAAEPALEPEAEPPLDPLDGGPRR